jgi:hypothetical protein
MDDDVDVSRLEDDGHRPDNEADQYEVSQSLSQS